MLISVKTLVELKGFKKIFLTKGESKIVDLKNTLDKLKFFDRNMHEVLEPGMFTVSVGKVLQSYSRLN
ncbi:hypothetical protein PbJCM13498_02000 [Prolixibacter bellariivorans]|uniref:Fibronectin type III-like domain-containing protein n=1 Tax=Prolixibacter bellariivorans TaxID=314319 RepID=A0A5M4AV85_9BACT|nr:fibronectin type III-like domain-contianing protein [Prolixibacter bellariivorans]GET31337.1 hypothetical protein PbJCM13498_02000 [Prolixibacter bellariivorans]